MKQKNANAFVEEIQKARGAIQNAMNCDYAQDKSIKMYLENAIAYLQNAKKLNNK